VLGSGFVSYAQNGEDVVLWRALPTVSAGHYVDVGASDPVDDSVTKAFYDRGWRGLNIEPVPAVAELLRTQRPGDVVLEAAIGATEASNLTFHEVVGTGLSTTVESIAAEHAQDGFEVQDIKVACRRLDEVIAEHGLLDREIHFLKIDVEGAEGDVLASVDLRRWRPWVLVVEATAPNRPEPTWSHWEPVVLAAGYQFCLFDGLSRFYVADEHADKLKDALSYPACPLDGYTSHRATKAEERAAEAAARAQALWADAIRWRAAALDRWSEAVVEQTRRVEQAEAECATARAEAAAAVDLAAHADRVAKACEIQRDDLEVELASMRQTLSWRVTAPLRVVRRLTLRGEQDS
jgi:FkbM family methyltransferase